jgi:hypothetical protein
MRTCRTPGTACASWYSAKTAGEAAVTDPHPGAGSVTAPALDDLLGPLSPSQRRRDYYLGLDAHVEPTIYDGLVEFTWRQEPKPKD